MSSLSDDAKAVIALATRLGDRSRPSLTAIQWSRFSQALAAAELTPADVFTPRFHAEGLPGLDAEVAARVRRLLEDAPAATVTVKELMDRGVWVRTIVDDDYPETLRLRLKEKAPPVLWGLGSPELLRRPGIGIVGSRNVSPEGAEVAQAFARLVAATGRTLVSGGARGVDQLAMNAAYRHGGAVLGILADSLLARVRDPDVLRALDGGATALVTEQHPGSGFSPAAAMSRNRLIYALSDVTFVVAADLDKGGTWKGAQEALRAGNGTVAVWAGPGGGSGNEALIESGATAVESLDRAEELIDVPPLEAEPEESTSTPEPLPEQLSLIE